MNSLDKSDTEIIFHSGDVMTLSIRLIRKMILVAMVLIVFSNVDENNFIPFDNQFEHYPVAYVDRH